MMRTLSRPAKTMLVFATLCCSVAKAGFLLTLVADSNHPISGLHLVNFSVPRLSDTGKIIFSADMGPSSPQRGLFTTDFAIVPAGTNFGGHTIQDVFSFDINKNGDIVFDAVTPDGPATAYGVQFFSTNPAIALPGAAVAGVPVAPTSLGLTDSGLVVFHANFNLAGQNSSGWLSPAAFLAKSGDVVAGVTQSTIASQEAPAVTADGTLYFSGYVSDTSLGILTPQRIVVRPGDQIGGLQLTSVDVPSVSSNGTLAFAGTFGSSATRGLFTDKAVLVKAGDTISGHVLTGVAINSKAVNNSGMVAFLGMFNGGSGVFTQSGAVAVPGDFIGGHTLSQIVDAPVINNSGVIAFSAKFSDGTTGIVQAVSSGGAPVSDNFGTLNTSVWTPVNPKNDASFTVSGGELAINVPGGNAGEHDAWLQDHSPRLLQPIQNLDFEVVAKIDSPVTAENQFEGIIVEENPATYIRYDVRNDGKGPRFFGATIGNGTPGNSGLGPNSGVVRLDLATPSLVFPVWLKLKRSGNSWDELYSTDGINFTDIGQYGFNMNTTQIGVFAGNSPGATGVVPPLNARFDYFWNTAAIPAVPNMTLSTDHSGNVVRGGSAVFSLTARNTGTGPTSGIVTVVAPPERSGFLTPAAASGTGWNCAVASGTATCTRSDSLAQGASYPAISLTLTAAANAPASVTYTASVSGGEEVDTFDDTASSTVAFTSGGGTIVPLSDDFNSSTGLNPGLWTIVSPLGDGSLTTNGSEVRLTVPAGRVHDVWTTGDNGFRIVQAISNADFDVVTKIDSPVTSLAQMEGIIVEQDPGRFVRFDLRHDGTSPRIFAASIGDGVGSFQVDRPLAGVTAPFWLRVTRSGNSWTESYSTDGNTFTVAGTFTYTLVSNTIGLFAGNNADVSRGVIPALTAAFDSFINLSTKAPDLTITKTHTGSFTAGGTGTFLITVRNAGTGPTTQFVSVNDVPPAGMTGISISGAGWTCENDGGQMFCTRTDALAPGAAFPVITLTVGISARTTASLTNTATVSTLGEVNTSNNSAADTVAITGGGVTGAPVSDDFNTTALNTTLWSYINPLGDGSQASDGATLQLGVPAGRAHDVWSTGDNGVRLEQSISNVDFDVVVKMNSPVTSGSQMEGIIVEQDANTFLRFDLRHDGNSPRIFAASIAGGAGTFRVDHALPGVTAPFWVRVKRSGSTWTESYSTDGTNFTVAGSFAFTLTASRIGLFVGNDNNAVTGQIPALNAIFDYFRVN